VLQVGYYQELRSNEMHSQRIIKSWF